MSGAFVNAVRVHEALTAKIEKRVLTWLAHRMPAAIHSDHLTGLALAAQILAGAAYAFVPRWGAAVWVVTAMLALNWFGDSLDGTVARVRNRQRPRYGFYVDHVADMFGALALMTGLACSRLAHWEIAVGMLVCFYALAMESYLAAYTIGKFHLSHGLLGPTEIRILLAAANAFVYWRPEVEIAGRRMLLFDVGGAIAIAGMAGMLLWAAVRHTALLYREERLG